MEIKRDRLLNELEAFVLSGNGIIVGLPGVGKTYSLGKLDTMLKRSGKLKLYIPLDKLDIESEEDLRSELGIRNDLVSYLREQAPSSAEAPGILLIDAFDAARSIKAQHTLYRLIRSIRHKLANSWNVIISVRTYDARKSQELQELFPSCDDNAPPDDFQIDGIRCRHFCIPELSDEEVQAAVKSIQRLPDICNKASAEFKELLRVPFNLWLLEQLLSDNSDIPELSSVASEVQLLGLYWRYRVLYGSNTDGQKVLLTRVASEQIIQNSLSVRREIVFDFSAECVWNTLFSAGVLTYTSSSEQRVAFSHNILFDYAVSSLLIEDDPERLVAFLSEDVSRPLFLRPSLVYYFTRLWYDTPEIFWRVFWHIIPGNINVHIRLFARILPTGVIVSEVNQLKQLEPLIDALKQGQQHAGEAVLRLLQAIDMSDIKQDVIWALLLEKISNHVERKFLWNVAALAIDISKRAEKDNDQAVFANCGQVGRNLAAWFWSEFSQLQDTWLANIMGRWIVPLITRTYSTNTAESRAVLEQIPRLIGTNPIYVGLLYGLVHGIEMIYPSDPEFAASIYEYVFSYQEKSDTKTYMGGRVIPFTSTLKQDYGMCQHWLIDKFPSFLRMAPVSATKAIIKALNLYIIRKHIINNLKDGVTQEDISYQFQLNGCTVTYLTDRSCIWDSMSHHDEPIRLADLLFDYITELAQDEKRKHITLIVSVMRDNARVAFFWRRLLAVASRFPKIFVNILYDLLLARPLQIDIDTEYQLGIFLEAVSPYLSEDQMIKVEGSILDIPNETNVAKKKYLMNHRNNLLARIPKELLTTPDAINIYKNMEKLDNIPMNKPPVEWSAVTGHNYAQKMWLEERGVDTTKPEHSSLFDLSEPLNDFNKALLNEKPTTDAIKAVMPVIKDVYYAFKSSKGVDKLVLEEILTILGASSHIISRAVIDLEDDQFNLCRDVLLTCASHESPRPDPERNFDYPGWSPAPRIEAAEGLPWLFAHKPDDDMQKAILKLAHDSVPPVRFLLQMEIWRIYPKSPIVFWDIIEERSKEERNQIVLHALLNSLRNVIVKEEKRSVDVLKHIEKNILIKDYDGELYAEAYNSPVFKDFAPFIIWLVLKRQNEWAEKFMQHLLDSPIRFAEVIDEFVSILLSQYVFNNIRLEKNDVLNRTMELVSQCIDAASNGIAELRAIPQDQWDDDLTSRMRATYGIIDNVVHQCYFALEADDSTKKHRKALKHKDEIAYIYQTIRPILEQILFFALDKNKGVLFASTAHTFMEMLNCLLEYDPARVLHMANDVIQSSKQSEYYLDSMAIGELVKFVELIMSDYRYIVRQEDSLTDLLNLLDTFADAGWAEALRLVWRLDEVFR